MPPFEKETNYDEAKALVIQFQNPSVAFLQRHLKLRYSLALQLMETLEADGVVTSPDEQGYRRLSPRFERNATEVSNCWRAFSDSDGASLEGKLVDVSAAVA